MRRTRGRIVAFCLTLAMVGSTAIVGIEPALAGPTISAVGSLATAHGTALTTLSVNPQNIDDLLAFAVKVGSSSIHVSSISGGGVTSWTKQDGPYTGYSGNDVEIWTGPVTTTGSGTITVSFSGSVTSIGVELSAQEFSATSGTSTTWGLDTSGSRANSSSTTVTFPTLSPGGSGELYFGYAPASNVGAAGSTSGFTYALTLADNIVAYDPSVSGSVSPTASQSPAGTSGAVAVLITATNSALATVTGVSPSSGYPSGGTSVTITGTNFTAATAVTFGTSAASGYTINSATSITATSPPGSPSTVDITVTGPAGTSATSSADHFTYDDPISAVGSLDSAHGTGVTTLSVSPANAGDLFALVVRVSSGSITASSIAGGGVGTWTRREGPYTGYGSNDLEIWTGVVTTTGSSTITVSFSGSVSSTSIELMGQEFSATSGSATTWSLDTNGGRTNSSSTTVTLPSLTPAGSGELYFSYAMVANTGSAGSTSGFTYDITPAQNVVAFNPNVSSAVSPTAVQSPGGVSGAVAVLIIATNYVYPQPSVVGYVYSLAGNGTSGSSGDNGQATEAALNVPISSAVDSFGDIYVADSNNNRIQEIAGTTHTQWGIAMNAGDIYTVAGDASGTSGTWGDGGAATSAFLNGPGGVAADSQGDLYIADEGNNRIQEIAATTGTQWGISMTADDIYTIAGSSSGTSGTSGDAGVATSALLDSPRNVALDAAGNLYIDDTTNNRIQEVATKTASQWGISMTANDIYTIAGSSSGTSGSSGDGAAATSALLSAPKGLTFDSVGNLFVADSNNNRVQEIANTTHVQWGTTMTANYIYTVVDGSGSSGSAGDKGPATSADLSAPRDVTTDSAGDLYVADGGNNRIQEVSASTGTQWGQSMTAGDVYTIAGNVNGTSGFTGDGGPAASALFNLPGGITSDGAGDLFVTDEGNNEVREVTANAAPVTAMSADDVYSLAGTTASGTAGDGFQGTEAQFDSPSGLAVDSSGNVYVADSSNNRVQEIAATTHTQWGSHLTAGDVYTIAGSPSGSSGHSGDGGAATSALLSDPSGVALDSAGDLYIADDGNNRVQFVAEATCSSECPFGVSTTAGDIYTVAGSSSGTSGSSGDAGAATSAFLHDPAGVALDGQGDLYVADAGNNRVQEIAATTQSQWGISMTADDIYTIAGSSSGTSGHTGNGGAATSALLNNAQGLSFDPSGNLYISDDGNNRIQEEAASTTTQWGQSMTADDIYTVAGSATGSAGTSGDGGAATSALLADPAGVAFDAPGDLYIVDETNDRIQEVAASTQSQWGQSMTVDDIYTVAGSATGTSGSSGDGGVATSALLHSPSGLATDGVGDLYVDDASNNEVREVVPAILPPTLPYETAGGGNPAEYNSQPQTPIPYSTQEKFSVNDATGTLSDSVTDLSDPSAGIPLDLTRTYDTQKDSILGPLGYGWTDSYNMSIAAGTGSLSNTEQVTQENGSVAYFYQNAQGGWTAPAREFATLSYNSGNSTWTFTRRKTSIFTFNSSGQLIEESDPNGYVTNLSYNPSGLLATVTANAEVPSGSAQSLIFTYTYLPSPVSAYVVSQVTDPLGEAMDYTYSSAGDLASASRVGSVQRVPGDLYSVAGNGSTGSSGDNAQATEAELDQPISSAVDSSGNVYVADESNNRVQEIAAATGTQWGISMTAGDVYTIAGSPSGTSGHSGDSGAATSALLDGPSGVAIDSAGDLYIADQGNSRIQEIAAATGTQWGISMTVDDIYTVAGSSSGTTGSSGDAGAATSALLDQPRNVAFDAAGNLYIDDTTNNRVQMVAVASCSSACPFGLASTTADDIYTVAGSSSGTSGSSGDGGAATSALLNNPKGLAFDSSGDLYVVDANNNRLQEVAAGGGTQWGTSMTAHDIYTVAGSSAGTSGYTGDSGSATSALLDAPRDVALDAAGDLYIADGGNNRIQEVAAASGSQWGTSMTADDIYTVAGSSSGSSGSGGDGGAATSAKFSTPGGVARDTAGDLFVTDEGNNEVREVAATAASSAAMSFANAYSILGNGGTGTSGDNAQGTEAELDLPTGVAIDGAGDLYIADQGNSRIQEIAAASGTQWGISMTSDDIYTVAGSSSGSTGTSGDAGAATSALLDQPRNVAFDGGGNLYIDDTTNNRVQMVAKASCSSGCPFGLASTTADDIYTVAGSSSGTSGSSGDGAAATSALLDNPKGLAFDSSGDLYIADANNNRVQVVTVACTTGCPWGLGSTTAGYIYTVAGSSSGTSGDTGDTGSATSALLDAPRDVAVDTAGDLYIADGGNNRIQEVASSNDWQWETGLHTDDIYTIAGSASGTSGSSGDGGPATSAFFNTPGGVTVDDSGDLFVTDEGNNEVREMTHGVSTQFDYWGGSSAHFLDTADDTDGNQIGTETQGGLNCPFYVSLCLAEIVTGGDSMTWLNTLTYDGDGTVQLSQTNSVDTLFGLNQYNLEYEIDGYSGTGTVPAVTDTTLDASTGQPFVVHQPTGATATSYYDTSGNATASIDARGDLATAQYNGFDEPLVSTNPLGEVTTDTYNADGDLTNSAQPIPTGGTASTSYGYTDSAHPDQKSSMTDPNTHTWDYTYAANGLEASETDPVGNETTYTYNSQNEKITMVSPRGNVLGGTPSNFTTSYAHDPYGNLIETSDPLGDSTFESYDGLGEKIFSTDANGNTTGDTYNSAGEQSSDTEPSGATATDTYNADFEETASMDFNSQSTTYAYDSRGDQTSAEDPLTHSTQYTYDTDGNQTSSTDQDPSTSTDAYNALNQLVSQTAGLGSSGATTTTYTYDADGNKTSSTNGGGAMTTSAYNALNQLVSTTDPLGRTTSFTYDAAGNKETETNPDGLTTTWTYYTDNKIDTITYSDGLTHEVSYTYDADGNVATMVDGSGTSTYTYDAVDRLITYENGASVTITYGYDAVGNVTSIEYASGKTVTQTFDSDNRLTSVTDWNSHTTTFTYDNDGNMMTTTLPNGIVDTDGYNTADQLTSITDKLGVTTVVGFTYGPTDGGLIGSETDAGTPGAGSTTYSYNGANELTGAGSTYSYDSSMDLTKAPNGNTQAYNADSELCWSSSMTGTCGSPPSGATTYTYSNEGNRTATTPSSGTSDAYGWTESNELKGVTPSSGSATSYVYDGNGLLQSETTGATTTDFTWNVQSGTPLMLSDGTNYYIYGLGTGPIEQIAVSGGSTSYLLSDQLGSTRAITNSSGTVTGSVTFDAWGNETGTSGSITTPFLYAGEYLDSPSGFYYLRARWYDPQTGLFVTLDPNVLSTGQPFTYGGDDPVHETDASGMGTRSEQVTGNCGTAFIDLTSYASGQINADIGFYDLCFDATFTVVTAWLFDINEPANHNNFLPSLDLTTLDLRQSYHVTFDRCCYGNGNAVVVIPSIEVVGVHFMWGFIPEPSSALDLLPPLEIQVPY